MKKETVKSVKAAYDLYVESTANTIRNLKYPDTRALLSIDAADAQGKLNGMTVVELLTIVNLTNATGERIILTANGKTLSVWAEKKRSI